MHPMSYFLAVRDGSWEMNPGQSEMAPLVFFLASFSNCVEEPVAYVGASEWKGDHRCPGFGWCLHPDILHGRREGGAEHQRHHEGDLVWL